MHRSVGEILMVFLVSSRTNSWSAVFDRVAIGTGCDIMGISWTRETLELGRQVPSQSHFGFISVHILDSFQLINFSKH